MTDFSSLHNAHAHFEQNITFLTHLYDQFQKFELFWLTKKVENLFDLDNTEQVSCRNFL